MQLAGERRRFQHDAPVYEAMETHLHSHVPNVCPPRGEDEEHWGYRLQSKADE